MVINWLSHDWYSVIHIRTNKIDNFFLNIRKTDYNSLFSFLLEYELYLKFTWILFLFCTESNFWFENWFRQI